LTTEERKEYENKWRERNKEKIKEYLIKNREKIREQARLRRIKNPEPYRQKSREYRSNNKEVLNEKSRIWYHKNKQKRNAYSRLYREQNKEKITVNRKIYWKEYSEKNKEKIRQRRLEQNNRNRQKIRNRTKHYRALKKLAVYNYYCNGDIKCNCCGERRIEFLTLDHIYNNGGHHRKKNRNLTGHDLYYWIIRNNFPPIFQILCMNCNFAKGKDKDHLCPHQKESGVSVLQ